MAPPKKGDRDFLDGFNDQIDAASAFLSSDSPRERRKKNRRKDNEEADSDDVSADASSIKEVKDENTSVPLEEDVEEPLKTSVPEKTIEKEAFDDRVKDEIQDITNSVNTGEEISDKDLVEITESINDIPAVSDTYEEQVETSTKEDIDKGTRLDIVDFFTAPNVRYQRGRNRMNIGIQLVDDEIEWFENLMIALDTENKSSVVRWMMDVIEKDYGKMIREEVKIVEEFKLRRAQRFLEKHR